MSGTTNQVLLDEQPQDAPVGNEPYAGPACEKCESPLATEQTTACPHCGWYASIGGYVEIEQEWESGQVGEEEPKTFLQVWLNLVPAWCWIAWGFGVLAVIESIAVRVLIADEAFRSTWSVTQLFAGIGVGIACHLIVFILMSIDDPELGILDIVVSPLRAWKKLFRGMPRHNWVLCLNNFGMTAAVGAMLIIGGIPYERIWDWDFKGPANKSLLGAIADAAPADENDMSMEEAMNSFASDAALDADDNSRDKKKHEGPVNVVRKETDALILGYQLDRNGTVQTLFLATEVYGRLMYAGRVTPEFATPDESLELARKLRAVRTSRPVVSAPDEGEWVQPRFTCRVTYDRRVESGRLQGLLWEEMLGEIKMPW